MNFCEAEGGGGVDGCSEVSGVKHKASVNTSVLLSKYEHVILRLPDAPQGTLFP